MSALNQVTKVQCLRKFYQQKVMTEAAKI